MVGHAVDDRDRLAALRQTLAGAVADLEVALDEIARLEQRLAAPPPPADLLPIREVKARLGLGDSTIYEMIADGRLPSVHLGRAVRVPADAVEALQRGITLVPRPPDAPSAQRTSRARPAHPGLLHQPSPRRPTPARLWHR